MITSARQTQEEGSAPSGNGGEGPIGVWGAVGVEGPTGAAAGGEGIGATAGGKGMMPFSVDPSLMMDLAMVLVWKGNAGEEHLRLMDSRLC